VDLKESKENIRAAVHVLVRLLDSGHDLKDIGTILKALQDYDHLIAVLNELGEDAVWSHASQN
jgi:hypothetical protein